MRDFKEEYRKKLRTPEEAVQVVKSGDWIDYTSSLGKPVLLDKALAKRRDELFDVKIRGNLISGPIEVAECDESQEHFIYHTWHCSAYERKLCDRGLCYFIPMVFHNNAAYYKYFLNVNVVMVSVSPMDKHGYFNYSVNTGVAAPIVQNADIVIVDMEQERRVNPKELLSRSDFSLFQGKTLRGWPVFTIKSGRVVAANGRLVDDTSRGSILQH